jgi:predicted nucleic acid-binding protein
MTGVLVDSNVLLDVLSDQLPWNAWSAAELAAAGDAGPIIINVVIFGEVSAGFGALHEVEALLPPDLYRREAIPFEAGFVAGRAFGEYRRRGGQRTMILPDFLIGAHAVVGGHRLLTRDAARYRSYFPEVELIAP